MSRPITGHYITPEAKRRFQIWLLDNNLSIASFSKKCEVSRQYISTIINGTNAITDKVRDTFKKGGYELL